MRSAVAERSSFFKKFGIKTLAYMYRDRFAYICTQGWGFGLFTIFFLTSILGFL